MANFRRGTVVSKQGSQVRVQFEDSDGMISPWLDVAQKRTKGRKGYDCFTEGELVRVLMDDNGETGEALHAIYSEANTAPIEGSDRFYEEMPDGSVLTWEGGTFSYINAAGTKFSVTGPDVEITGNVKISGNLDLAQNLSVSGTTDLQATKILGITQVGD